MLLLEPVWGFLFIIGSITNDLPVDKAAHFGLSHVSTHALYELCILAPDEPRDNEHFECAVAASALTLIGGVLWERQGKFEGFDIAADIIGIGSANALIHLDWFYR